MKNKIFPLFFILSILMIVFGALKKIMHHSGSQSLLIIGLLSIAAYTIVALYEILNSRNITPNEKLMWLVGFLLLNGLAAFTYFIYARKRIIRY